MKLEEVLTQDYSNPGLDIRLVDNERTLRATSFQDLLARDLPDHTSRLYATVNSWNDERGIDAGCSIDLNHNGASFQLHDVLESRFFGKRTQVERFFKDHRPWYSWINISAPFVFPPIIVSSLFTGAIVLRDGNYVAAVFCVTLAIITSIFAWLSFRGSLFPYVSVFPKEHPARPSKFEILTAVLQVALLLATLASVVAPIVRN
jgi:hypothetical protein